MFFSAFSQEKTKKRKITNGISSNFMSFQFMNSSNSKLNDYASTFTNSAVDGTIDINFPILKKSEITTGIGLNYRFGNAYIENIDDVRIIESFIRIPVKYKYIHSGEKKSIIPFLSLGTYLDILGSQDYYFKNQTNIPNNFETSNGFGSYLKTGINLDIGFRFQTQTKMCFDLGMSYIWDIDDLFINPDNIKTYDYSAYGLYLAIIFM